MTLLFIYGPPGVGKLTIAKKIITKTKLKLFHNHHTYDIAESMYGTRNRKKISTFNMRLRNWVFDDVIAQQINLVFTFFYVRGYDDNFVKGVIKKFNKCNNKVIFVKLEDNLENILNRIENVERKKFKKVNSKDKLIKLSKKYSLFDTIEYVDNIIIKCNNRGVEEIAAEIQNKISKYI